MRRSLRYLLPLFVLAAVLAVGTLFRSGTGDGRKIPPDGPRIVDIPDQIMLVCEVTGDPDRTAGPAINRLYKAYFSLRKKHKGMKFVAPRARWTGDLTDRNTWTGVFGLPLPGGITNLSPAQAGDEPALRLTVWPYGLTGEILHRGDFDTEGQTIDILKDFVGKEGYRLKGVHEEEYTGRNLTVLRYSLEKKR